MGRSCEGGQTATAKVAFAIRREPFSAAIVTHLLPYLIPLRGYGGGDGGVHGLCYTDSKRVSVYPVDWHNLKRVVIVHVDNMIARCRIALPHHRLDVEGF